MEINNKNILTILIFSLLFINCKKEVTERNIINDFTYNIYNDLGLNGLEKLKVTINRKERIDSVIRYSKERIIQDTVVNRYGVSSLGLFDKNNNYYLDISIDSCYQIADEYVICYKGKEDIKVESISYNNLYKFLVTQIYGSHSLKTIKYYDKDFILVRNELIEGDRRYFRVDRIDEDKNQ
jgi:hypothetical protein